MPERGLGRGTVVASSRLFMLPDETALPLWQAQALFARGGPDPMDSDLTVVAPPDFRVLAPGKPLKPGAVGNLVAHRFKIRPDEDLLPYVVAGRYLEQTPARRRATQSFWTLQPLDGQQAQTAGAARLFHAGLHGFFRTRFERQDRNATSLKRREICRGVWRAGPTRAADRSQGACCSIAGL